MFREAGRAAADLQAMAAPFRRWLEPRLADGRYFGFMALDADAAIGGVGLMEVDWPPHPLHPQDDRRGYVLNLFVNPSHRRMGVAGLLMQASEDAFVRRGISYVFLHATEAGRPLYLRTGWTSTNEMAKTLQV